MITKQGLIKKGVHDILEAIKDTVLYDAVFEISYEDGFFNTKSGAKFSYFKNYVEKNKLLKKEKMV